MTSTRFQYPDKPASQALVDTAAAWILVTGEHQAWTDIPPGAERARRRRRLGGEGSDCWSTDLPNKPATCVAHVVLPAGASAFERLTLARRAVAAVGEVNPRKLLVSVLGVADPALAFEAVASAVLALKDLNAPFQVDCWRALAAKHIGPEAYPPNDIVKAADGTSIEVVDTDAAGRMVLADTLLVATASKPDLVIDYATLTGACSNAIGKRYSGVFSNREALLTVLTAAGQASGERVWPFPLEADFDKALESTVADVQHCTLDGETDHILAACFLQRCVRHGVPWVHVDLSASNHTGGLAHVPTEETGFGVRFTCNLLLDQGVMGKLPE